MMWLMRSAESVSFFLPFLRESSTRKSSRSKLPLETPLAAGLWLALHPMADAGPARAGPGANDDVGVVSRAAAADRGVS
jgi:hypothetical protein